MVQNACIIFSKSSNDCFNDYRLQLFPFDQVFTDLNDVDDLLNVVENIKSLKDEIKVLHSFYQIQNQDTGKFLEQTFNSKVSAILSLLDFNTNFLKKFTDTDYSNSIYQRDVYQFVLLFFSNFNIQYYDLINSDTLLSDTNHLLNLFQRAKLEIGSINKSIALFLNMMMLQFEYYQISRWKIEFISNNTLTDYTKQYIDFFDPIYSAVSLLNCPSFTLSDHSLNSWNKCQNQRYITLNISNSNYTNDTIQFGQFNIPNIYPNIINQNIIDFETFMNLIPSFPDYKSSTNIMNPVIIINGNLTNEFGCQPGYYGINCVICPVGTWSNDGYLHLCSNAPPSISNYINQGETNPNCDFICILPQHYRDGNNCIDPPIGKYPKTKDNGIQSLDDCYNNYPNWIQWISPGYYGNPNSCNYTIISLMNIETENITYSSISFYVHFYMDLDINYNGIIEIANFGALKFYGEIINQTMNLNLYDINNQIYSKSDGFNFWNGWIHMGFAYDSNLNNLLFYFNNIINVFYSPFVQYNISSISIGSKGKFPFKIKNIMITNESLSLDSFNIPNHPICLNGTKFQNSGCFKECNGTLDENGLCLCKFGMFMNNSICIQCPNRTIGSNYPRYSINDCICEKGKSMDLNGTCITSKESLNRPDISIITQNATFNNTFFVGSYLKISQNYTFDVYYQINIYKGNNLTYNIKSKTYNYQFNETGDYIITCSLEQDGRNPGLISMIQIKIIDQLPLPSLFPNEGILMNPTLLKINYSFDNIYYSLDQSFPIRKYQNNTPIFIKPGDQLNIFIKSDNDYILSNEKFYNYYSYNNDSYQYQNPIFQVNYLKELCENDLETCLVLFGFISFISFLPFIILIFILCLVFCKRKTKCEKCKFKKVELKCLDCNERYCIKCYKKYHDDEDHFIIGKDNLYLVKYSFESQSKNELSIKEGEIVKIIRTKGKGSENGWVFGMNMNMKVGYFPKYYVIKKI